jgi:hypothetical protein
LRTLLASLVPATIVFFAVRPGKNSSSGGMLWRPNFPYFMRPCGQPLCKPASLDHASGSQPGLYAALCQAAMAGGSSASGLLVPLHSYTTRILSAQIRQFQSQSTAQQSLTESQLSTVSPLMSQLGAATPSDRNPNADLLTSLVGTTIC